MGGALLQIVAQGQQDVYLTGNPQITFWKVVYRRHTNFAIESIKQSKSGSFPDETYTIERVGDLIHKCYLKVTVPELTATPTLTSEHRLNYINKLGHALIDTMSLKIGGVVIDTQTGEFLDIWSQLTLPEEKRVGYEFAIGHDDTIDEDNYNKRTFYIPLQFFFCQHPGSSLPLIALQYHQVQIDFKFRKFSDLVYLVEENTSSGNRSAIPNYSGILIGDHQIVKEDLLANQNDKTINIEFFVDYVYLDSDERRRMAQSAHEILITQTKKISHIMPSGVDNDKIDMKNLNHPVKELIWIAREKKEEDPAYYNHGNKYFQYNYHKDDFDNVDNTNIVFEEIMKNASITLNGTNRISTRDSMFFRFVQPYQHHTRVPLNFIYLYSFALKPEEVQPSGSCNFSRIDSAYLNVENNPSSSRGLVEYVIYALNWNVLRIQSGMGGIAFTN